MGAMKHAIARGLFRMEQRAPCIRRILQGAAYVFGRIVAERLEYFRQQSLLCSAARTGPWPDKMNCWEYSDCCRQVHGSLSGYLGICPAALESRLDGIHGGWNGGRACWVVPGTHCYGAVQSSPERKNITCSQCGFYRAVQSEEGLSFIDRKDILQALVQ